MDVFQNMELFSELIQCGDNIYTWCYNADGSLLQSNCPEAGFLSGAFDLFGCKKKMLDYGSRHTTPVTLIGAARLGFGVRPIVSRFTAIRPKFIA